MDTSLPQDKQDKLDTSQVPEHEQDKFYLSTGRFLSLANSVEFFLNGLLESITGAYTAVIGTQAAIDETIDHIEEQSVRVRTNLIILFLTMTKGTHPQIQQIIPQFRDFAQKYNKSIRPIRDYIAHNPLFIHKLSGEQQALFVSSRRYKKGINSLSVDEMKAKEELLFSLVDSLQTMAPIIQGLYSEGGTRELYRTQE